MKTVKISTILWTDFVTNIKFSNFSRNTWTRDSWLNKNYYLRSHNSSNRFKSSFYKTLLTTHIWRSHCTRREFQHSWGSGGGHAVTRILKNYCEYQVSTWITNQTRSCSMHIFSENVLSTITWNAIKNNVNSY